MLVLYGKLRARLAPGPSFVPVRSAGFRPYSLTLLPSLAGWKPLAGPRPPGSAPRHLAIVDGARIGGVAESLSRARARERARAQLARSAVESAEMTKRCPVSGSW